MAEPTTRRRVIPEAFTPKLVTLLGQGYSGATLRADLGAGLTVAIVALPLAMALAIASGASPHQGLVTAIVAGFLISALGGSRVQIGGPTGAFVVVVAGVIHDHGYSGLVLATLLAGVMLVIAGYARLGQLIRFIPHPVITGFTAGIAVIIASTQIKDFLGLKPEPAPPGFVAQWQAYAASLDTVQATTLAVGTGTLGLILLLRRLAPRAPGYLIAIVLASAAVWALALPVETIGARFGTLPGSLPAPGLPAISFELVQAVIPSAFVIAFLAGVEALLSAVVADGMAGSRHRPNQELVGQGVANIASALMGGLPATGALARTATNIKAGARSPVAGMAHALFLLLFMLVAGPAMARVPMAALAAILLVVAWGMSEIHAVIQLVRLPTSDRVVMALTFLLTVLVDLTVAIGVGVVLASLLFMLRMSQSVEIAAEHQTPAGEPQTESADDPGQRSQLPPGVEVFRIAGPVFFGVASELVDTLARMGRRPRLLILRLELMPYLDASGIQALRTVVQRCDAQGIAVMFAGVQPQVRALLAGFGSVTMAASYDEALALARASDPARLA